ncbi:hypothetical protein [Streptomyces sp. NPDC001851]|uniref:hypothetical protein n=1 Tax=Streptomyces sp. NPDC001851 TaxID=3154529 RepID=UPI00332F5AEF
MARSSLPIRLVVAAGLLALCSAGTAAAATPGPRAASFIARAAAVEDDGPDGQDGPHHPGLPWCEDTSWGG